MIKDRTQEVSTTHDIEANGKRYVMEWGDDWITITEASDEDNEDLETYDYFNVTTPNIQDAITDLMQFRNDYINGQPKKSQLNMTVELDRIIKVLRKELKR